MAVDTTTTLTVVTVAIFIVAATRAFGLSTQNGMLEGGGEIRWNFGVLNTVLTTHKLRRLKKLPNRKNT